MMYTRIKFTIASATPTTSEMRNSLNRTLKKSLRRISSNAMPLITIVDVCEPQLPPVSISIGINATSMGMAENASSYRVIIAPVNVAESIKTSSQTILCLAGPKTEVLK